MPTPVILVDGQAPPPLGLKANGTKADGDTVTLSIASALGIDSIEWRVSKPDGSSAALGSAFPSAPFSTTLGPLAAGETYLIDAIANGDPTQVAHAAVMVPTSGGLRVPRAGETTEWDRADGIETDWRALAEYAGGKTVLVAVTGDVTLSDEESAADIIYLTGSPAASHGVTFTQVRDGLVAIINSTGHAHTIVSSTMDAAGAVVDGGIVVFMRVVDMLHPIGGPRGRKNVTGAGGTTVLEPGAQTVGVNTAPAGQTIQLPHPQVRGGLVTVKDTSGHAAAHNIVVTTTAGDIDGVASVTINTNKGAITFESDGNNWTAIAKY